MIKSYHGHPRTTEPGRQYHNYPLKTEQNIEPEKKDIQQEHDSRMISLHHDRLHMPKAGWEATQFY